MTNEKGFIELKGLIPTIFGLAMIVGIIVMVVIPWIWGLLKPFIHAWTG